MLLTTGDLYFTILTGGALVAFTGIGLAVADAPRWRLWGASLFAAGLAAIVSPMLGVVGLIARHL